MLPRGDDSGAGIQRATTQVRRERASRGVRRRGQDRAGQGMAGGQAGEAGREQVASCLQQEPGLGGPVRGSLEDSELRVRFM